MSKKLRNAILGTALLVSALFASAAFAQVGGVGGGNSINIGDLNPIAGCGQLDCVLLKVIELIANIAKPIASIMVLWGGFQIITAGGSPEKVKVGGKTILYSVIGLAITFLVGAVVPLIQDVIGGGQGGGGGGGGGGTCTPACEFGEYCCPATGVCAIDPSHC